jgi:hypothetical protein
MKTQNRPELIEVRVLPNEKERGLYDLSCAYSDGVTLRELWGHREETEIAAAVRRMDIKKSAPLPKTSALRAFKPRST